MKYFLLIFNFWFQYFLNSACVFFCDFLATNFEEFMAFGDSLFSGFSDL